MQKLFLLVLIIGIVLLPELLFSQIFTIGPVLNWNIGDKQCRFSGGVEIGIHGLPVGDENGKGSILSLDIGLESGKTKNRFYTELQFIKYIPGETVVVFYGLSAGPVIEWGKDTKTRIGIQTTAWGCLLLGASLRYRWINKKSYIVPGMFFKFPLSTKKINLAG
jgi:hypothetical protein